MGNSNFFAKFASIDPLAQMLNLPGAHKYAQQQAQDRAGQTDTNGGAYTGVAPTLAGANAGYKPGGPGATPGFVPTQPSGGGGLFGALQKGSNLAGNSTPLTTPATPNISTANPGVQPNTVRNPWVQAAGGAVPQSTQQRMWG